MIYGDASRDPISTGQLKYNKFHLSSKKIGLVEKIFLARSVDKSCKTIMNYSNYLELIILFDRILLRFVPRRFWVYTRIRRADPLSIIDFLAPLNETADSVWKAVPNQIVFVDKSSIPPPVHVTVSQSLKCNSK